MLRRLAQAGLLRVITNFRHQRVAEVWPLNGLREDFRVDTAGRLLSEEGVGSLTNQFPRPVREYVWLGAHPVAVLEATESAAGAVTPKGVTFVHSGHLGEPLTETDESGRVLRQYFFTPFGERRELGAVASPVSFATASPYTNHSKAVPVPAARATKLHFTELALASCDSIVISDGYGGPVVAEIPASASGDFWTEWLATDNAYVELRAKGCGTARGFSLVEALPEWGGVSSLARTDSTAHPYPAAGQHFRVSLGSGGFVRLKDLNVASCDAVEARTPSGQTLWKWTPLPSVYQVWTPRLVGDVDIGIWGQGCNGTERKFGFTLAEERRDSGAVQPVSIGLPGQRSRADGTIENWYRNYDASLGRYLSPEPLLQSPAYVRLMAQSGMSVPTYAYAANNPIRYADPTGLDIAVIENGPTQGNPIGHTAIAVTGEGVYSFGNDTPLGSSLAAYIQREAPRRNTKIYIIKTTPEQDAAAVASLRSYTKRLGITSDNCSSRSNAALDAAKVPGGSVFPNLPGTAGTRAMFLPGQLDAKGNPAADFTQVRDINKTTGPVTIPSALGQFEPP